VFKLVKLKENADQNLLLGRLIDNLERRSN